jgi:transposase
VPTDSDYHTAVELGYWDVDCPRCGGREAVGLPDDDRVWCPVCDK